MEGPLLQRIIQTKPNSREDPLGAARPKRAQGKRCQEGGDSGREAGTGPLLGNWLLWLLSQSLPRPLAQIQGTSPGIVFLTCSLFPEGLWAQIEGGLRGNGQAWACRKEPIRARPGRPWKKTWELTGQHPLTPMAELPKLRVNFNQWGMIF